MRGRVKLPRSQIQHAPGLFKRKPVVHGAQHGFQGKYGVSEAGFGLAPGKALHVRALLPEAEKGKAFHEFHQGRGLGLLRRGAFAHLLASGHDGAGVSAADAEIDRDAQAACVHPAGFRQDVQIRGGQTVAYSGYGLCRADGLVQIFDISLGAGTQTDNRQGCAHARSRIRML